MLVKEINKPLFEESPDSKLSVCVRLLATKSKRHVPNQCLEFFSKMMLGVTPKSYYDAKKLEMVLEFKKKLIVALKSACCFMTTNSIQNDGMLEAYKYCNARRY